MLATRYPEYQWDNNTAGIPANTNIDSGVLIYRSIYSTNIDGCRYVVRMATSASTTSLSIDEPAGIIYRI